MQQAIITHTDGIATDGSVLVEMLVVNDSQADRQIDVPAVVAGQLQGDRADMVSLERADDTSSRLALAPGAFATVRYKLNLGANSATMAGNRLISIPQWNTAQVSVKAPRQEVAISQPERGTIAPMANHARHPPVQSRLEREENRFLANFSPYEPSYIVFGTAKDSEWRVQLSFKYRLIGSAADGARPSWRDGLYFGFTNKLFWDIASDSSFRDANYLPELFYRTPEFALSSHTGAGLQVGLQHESNGRAGKIQGRSVNNVYISPTVSHQLGDGYRLSLAPRAVLLVGGKAGNPDILKYRGASSLDISLGKDDGLLLSASGRYNFRSGKGGLETDLSYPIDRFLGGPNLYLFVQSFTGYGESLFDYNRRMNRLRIGVAITR